MSCVRSYNVLMVKLIDNFIIWLKQVEAEVVPSLSSVQFKLESDLVGLRFVKFI